MDEIEPSPDANPELPEDTISEEIEPVPVTDNRIRLNEYLFPGLDHLEHNFLFRKLGVAYDYAAAPGDFPWSSLPRAGEVKDGKPNAAGIGAGMTDSAYNTCLLLDGYAARLELGLSRPEEDRIMDRLVAGIIRLGTMGPKGVLVRGLTPDGRSYYATSCLNHHIMYAHGMLRAYQTPVVAPESQAKLSNIYAKWLRRLDKDDYTFDALTPEEGCLMPEGETAGGIDDTTRFQRRIAMMHLLLVGRELVGAEPWNGKYKEISTTEGFALKSELPAGLTDTDDLLAVQIALRDISLLEEDEERQRIITLLRRKIAYRMLPKLAAYKKFAPSCPFTEAALNWRADLSDRTGTEAELRAVVCETWPRLKEELTTVHESGRAMLAIMISGDEQLISDNLDPMIEMVRSIPWGELLEIGGLAALPLAHALGHEKEFWDPEIYSAMGETPFGQDFGFEHEEGYEPLPEEGPRPKGWTLAKRTLPKVIQDMEKKEEDDKGGNKKGGQQQKSRSRSRSGNNDNKRRGRRGRRGRGRRSSNNSNSNNSNSNNSGGNSRNSGEKKSST